MTTHPLVMAFTPVGCSPMRHREMPFEMNPKNIIPIRFGHGDNRAIPENSRIVHHHINVTEGFHTGSDNRGSCIPVGDIVMIGYCHATGGTNLLGDSIGRSSI